jgi:hypothetical protein
LRSNHPNDISVPFTVMWRQPPESQAGEDRYEELCAWCGPKTPGKIPCSDGLVVAVAAISARDVAIEPFVTAVLGGLVFARADDVPGRDRHAQRPRGIYAAVHEAATRPPHPGDTRCWRRERGLR